MNLIHKIELANSERKLKKMGRRILKLGEEAGELNTAYLQVTSKANTKKKTWADVREEAVDAAIVAIDVALTPLPGDEAKTREQIREEVEAWFNAKLDKWIKSLIAQTAPTIGEIDDAV